MNKLSSEDSAAIVNFFEGEGCICINNERRNDGAFSIGINITSTNEEKLYWFKKTIGIGDIRLQHKETKTDKVNYAFRLQKCETKDFLEVLIHSKYLMIKKYQALAMLEYLKETTNCCKREGINTTNGELRMYAEEYGIRANIYDAVCLLNKRGPYTQEELIELTEIKRYYDIWFKENYPNLQKAAI